MGEQTMRGEILMLAGGVGKRLWPVTNGEIPKCLVPLRHNLCGLDVILDQLDRVGVKAIFSADNYYYQYEKRVGGRGHKMLWQKPGGVAEAILQLGTTVFAIAPDCLWDMTEIPSILDFHKPGTITWVVSSALCPLMDSYAGLDITENGAVVGRNDKSFIRLPAIIVDPDVVAGFSPGIGEDFFLGVMKRIEAANGVAVSNGLRSFVNAYILKSPALDYGVPERLALAGVLLDEIVYLRQ